MKRTNVLIFPAGAENSLEIYEALKYNLHFNVFGASSKRDYAEMLYPKDHFCIGNFFINSPEFIHNFNQMLDAFEIEWIIPTHDTIALYLEEVAEQLHAEMVCSNKWASYVARNKQVMFDELKDETFVPTVYHAPYSDLEFPVFVKPNIGEGAKGACLIKSKEGFERLKNDLNNMVVCEYLPGMEYTVDCFTDRHGRLLFVGPRTRERIGMGITFQSCRKELTNEIYRIAEIISRKFRLRGAWFFQIKEDKNGVMKLMEFSVRMAGTMVFYRQLGINFPALSLFDAMGMDVTILFNDYPLQIERCIKTAFRFGYKYDTLYVDFDDTLIVNGAVNTTIVKLIYQSIQKGIKVVLLTKHVGDLNDSLAKYRISENLFDKIIHIIPGASKADYISPNGSVLIDNYFIERREVRERLNIPVFDVDAAACLIDESLL
ncbi:ATP-grasp domain-containing protein [Flavonifractor sp. An306]|uniref:ATP-grasp domain-containing protein n=1 Tax=Flavonifractor sp. An306 TaxID=1965629 RepID=UPI00111DEFA7|nr:ATP-grasp domain-containing protein [Flavonifractor sp. An306]